MKAFLLKYRSSLLLFAVMFLFGWGSAAVVAKWQSDRETEETMHIEAAVDNWGLGFGESGKELQPTGNATADELKQYDTYYIGSKEEKVIYLTFDCGYENGNTGAILDALGKHNAPGTFLSWDIFWRVRRNWSNGWLQRDTRWEITPIIIRICRQSRTKSRFRKSSMQSAVCFRK